MLAIVCGTLALLVVAPLAGADVLVSNLANVANDGFALRDTQWLAQGFATDAETRAVVSVLVDVGGNFGAGGLIAEIRTSEAGDPGAAIGTLTASNPPLTLLPDASIELAPNTTYFLVLGFPLGNPNTMGAWKATADLASTGSGSFTTPRYSFDQGDGWASAGFATQRLRTEVIADVVPEPAAFLLGAAAIAALGAIRAAFR